MSPTPATAPARPDPVSTGQTSRPYGGCRNCDAPLTGAFCSQCGQRDGEYAVSLRVLARDFADEYLSFDSRLFRSIFCLFFRPGFLTRQYLIGRRERYVRPLRLYIVASLLFFLVVPLVLRLNIEEGRSVLELFQAQVLDDTVSVPAATDSLTGAVPQVTPMPDFGSFQVGGRTLSINDRVYRLSGMTPQQLFDIGVGGLERYLPRIMFVLLPVFAFLLKLLYVRRRWYYAEHFVFALHFHAFLFAIFFLLLVLPTGVWTGALVFWSILYLAVAMQKVYKQAIWRTGIKFLLLTWSYSSLVAMGIVASVLLGMFLA